MENLAWKDLLSVEANAPRTEPLTAECQRIARAIQELTHAAVRDLRVETISQTILLAGECGTFYIKQLAQEAALPLAGGLRIQNEIVVRHSQQR